MEGDRRAVRLLRESIQLDSLYAPSFGELAYRLHQLSSYDPGKGIQITDALKAAQRSLEINPRFLNGLADLTSIYTEMGRTEDAILAGRKALALNPDDPMLLFFLGYTYRYAGMLEESLRLQERAVALDANPRFRSIAITYVYLGKLEQALHAIALDTSSGFGVMWKAEILFRMGRRAEAAAVAERLRTTDPTSTFTRTGQVFIALYRGNTKEASAALLGESFESLADGESIYHVAEDHALLGEWERAATALQRALNHGYFNYPFMQRDSFLDPVRSHPAIREVLEKVRLKYEQFQRQLASLEAK
jgi:tetratricopeptide (TPR) repeat protein